MILGITGKIASGKSEALKILSRMGFCCVDADKIVHDLYKNGRIGQVLIEKHFWKEYLLPDGDVDRKKLGGLVFRDKSKLLVLNKLIHPCANDEIKKQIDKVLTGGFKNVAVEAVYLDQNNLGGLVDKILIIERPKEERLAVLIDKRKESKDIANKMIDIITLPAKADFVIHNNGSLKDLESELRKIL